MSLDNLNGPIDTTGEEHINYTLFTTEKPEFISKALKTLRGNMRAETVADFSGMVVDMLKEMTPDESRLSYDLNTIAEEIKILHREGKLLNPEEYSQRMEAIKRYISNTVETITAKPATYTDATELTTRTPLERLRRSDAIEYAEPSTYTAPEDIHFEHFTPGSEQLVTRLIERVRQDLAKPDIADKFGNDRKKREPWMKQVRTTDPEAFALYRNSSLRTQWTTQTNGDLLRSLLPEGSPLHELLNCATTSIGLLRDEKRYGTLKERAAHAATIKDSIYAFLEAVAAPVKADYHPKMMAA
ncbi:MAG: hypothetical protein OXR66_08950 [Candidatus Woesearchaeota archaeon]|nr:hypothetical protein [Candidatus Woesearchaeota archaeon]